MKIIPGEKQRWFLTQSSEIAARCCSGRGCKLKYASPLPQAVREGRRSWVGSRQARLTCELFHSCGGLGPAGVGDVLSILLRRFCKSPRLPETPPGNIPAPLPRTNRLRRAEAGAAELSAPPSRGLLLTVRSLQNSLEELEECGSTSAAAAP